MENTSITTRKSPKSRLFSWYCKGLHAIGEKEEDTPSNCERVPESIIRRPEPNIYSQDYLFGQGQVITWDNPDLITNIVSPNLPITDNIQATIHNSSSESDSLNTIVRFSFGQFGIGFPVAVYDQVSVNIPKTSSTTITVPSPNISDDTGRDRFTLKVEVIHPQDSNKDNNVGFQAVDGLFTTQTLVREMRFRIPVRNPLSSTIQINFSHTPDIWFATVNPLTVTLNPFEETIISFDVSVPIGAQIGTIERFNIHAITSSNYLLGGVNLIAGVNSVLPI